MLKSKIGVLIGAALLASACTTVDPNTGQTVPNRAGTGAIIGAIGGAPAGTAAGGNDRRNAIIGAGVGAIAGAAVGGYMDNQEKKLRERLGSSGVGIARTAENEIMLSMPNDITFGFDQATLKPEFRASLSDVAQTLREYPSTTVDVMGHADSVGADAYNQSLSQRRADAVTGFLRQSGVLPERLVSIGYGESRPVASNDTPDGRAQNRRVEIRLRPVTTS